MKLSPQSTAGASGELFLPCPKYIVQSQWPNGRKVLGYFAVAHLPPRPIGCSRLHGSGEPGHRAGRDAH
jgi:hypothetical protein